MNQRIHARSTILETVWQCDRNGTHWSDLVERRESSISDGGDILQRCIAPPSTHLERPPVFVREVRKWSRFFAAQHLDELLLRRRKRRLHLLGPPPRFIDEAPLWTLYASFRGRALGRRIITFSDYCRVPDLKPWMCRIATVQNLSRIQTETNPTAPLYLDGSLLVTFLAGAMDHVVWLGEQRGHWTKNGHTHRFQPAETKHFDRRLDALLYDADRHLMYCTSGDDPRLALAVPLGEPLYRFVPRLTFTHTTGCAVVKGVRYQMPAAYLHPNKEP